MKIVAISGSSRPKHTDFMIKTFLDACEGESEVFYLRDLNIDFCKNCKYCHKSFECRKSDDMVKIYPKLKEADVIVLASPTYFDNVSGLMKNFMDRCAPFYFSQELKGKKVVLLSVGGFKEYVPFDKEGNCEWCDEDDDCTKTVQKCIDAMKSFCFHLGMEVVGEVGAIHGSPEDKVGELEELAKKIK